MGSSLFGWGLFAFLGSRAFAVGLSEPEPRWCCALGERPPLTVTYGTSTPLSLEAVLEHQYGGTGYFGVVENVAFQIVDTVRSVARLFPRQAVSRDPVGYVYTARSGIVSSAG